jgi:murein DD-endopeptidase MepM/ murein hydrolase activator NlpD
MVILVHRGGSETLYGHLRPRRLVAAGEMVRRGEVIGSMGDTGRSTGVHLYFAISRGFRVIDPLDHLRPAR